MPVMYLGIIVYRYVTVVNIFFLIPIIFFTYINGTIFC